MYYVRLIIVQDLEELFDVVSVRGVLETKQQGLQAELQQVNRSAHITVPFTIHPHRNPLSIHYITL